MKRLFLLCCLLVSALTVGLVPALAQDATAAPVEVTDLDGVKTYLLGNATLLAEGAQKLADDAGAYYDLAKAADFDYEAMWKDHEADAVALIQGMKDQWVAISPTYEQIEGIVAGVPLLSEFDVIIDAGASAEEDPENAADFNVTLPDGTLMEKPGNLFGLLEASLWGTRPELTAGIEADVNGDGTIEFGEVIPDASIVKGAADSLASYTADLVTTGESWEPNQTDAFGALVGNIPTVSDFFEAWKESRFVMGDEATRTDFVAISRLSDIKDNVASWQAIYSGLSPAVAGVDADRDQQITEGLDSLQAYVLDLYTQEHEGRQFTPEEADFYGSEAQDRANAITGQVAQAAALLDVTLPE